MISKQRIFVCDNKDLLATNGKISDERALRIFRRQVQPVEEGGFGFDVRILWADTLRKTGSQVPPNLLIIDGKEAVIVKGIEEAYLGVEAITNATIVRSYQRQFESCWEIAEPVTNYLPE